MPWRRRPRRARASRYATPSRVAATATASSSSASMPSTRRGARPTLPRRPALYWLSATVTAARAYGLDVLDGVYNNFRDADGLRRECVHGRRLGFDGKTLIHPTQVATANEVFAPPEAELAFARKIIAAF